MLPTIPPLVGGRPPPRSSTFVHDGVQPFLPTAAHPRDFHTCAPETSFIVPA